MLVKLEINNHTYGTWRYDQQARTVGGKPLPSEGEAHHFEKVVIPLINTEINRIMSEQFHVEYSDAS